MEREEEMRRRVRIRGSVKKDRMKVCKGGGNDERWKAEKRTEAVINGVDRRRWVEGLRC